MNASLTQQITLLCLLYLSVDIQISWVGRSTISRHPASQTDFQNLRNDRLRTFLVVHFISPPTAVSAPTKSWFFDRHLCNGHSTSKVEESRPNVIIKGETILIRNRSVRCRFHLVNPHLIVHLKIIPNSQLSKYYHHHLHSHLSPSSSPFITIITITTITFIISIIIRIMPIDRVGACAAIFAYRLECGWPRVGGSGIIIIIVITVLLIMVEGINPNRQNPKL